MNRITALRPGARLAAAIALAIVTLVCGCVTPPPTPEAPLLSLYPPERPFLESRFATLGGIALHYRAWTPEAPPRGKILLLHAAGASTVSFRTLGPLLAEAGFAVLAVDLPGFGFSDQALEFDHNLMNRSGLLWSLADRLDTEPNEFPPAERWIVAGHGMGGHVAVSMALERPARTERLLLFATEVLGTQRAGRGFWFPPVRWAWRSWLRNSLYTREGVAELLGEALGRPATEEETALYAAPLAREQMPDAYVNYARTAGEMTLDLGSIGSPTLLVWGEADGWVGVETGEATAAAIPESRLLVVPGAAHLPMETHAEEVAAAIIGWTAPR